MSEILTAEQVAAITLRADEATPGPWEIRYGGNFTDIGSPWVALEPQKED